MFNLLWNSSVWCKRCSCLRSLLPSGCWSRNHPDTLVIGHGRCSLPPQYYGGTPISLKEAFDGRRKGARENETTPCYASCCLEAPFPRRLLPLLLDVARDILHLICICCLVTVLRLWPFSARVSMFTPLTRVCRFSD